MPCKPAKACKLVRDRRAKVIKRTPLTRQTRRAYLDLPQKGKGRVKFQVNAALEGFRKGDVVRVKGRYVKRVNSIYSNGYLAFPPIKGEPAAARPKDCQLLERGRTLLWERKTGQNTQEKAMIRDDS